MVMAMTPLRPRIVGCGSKLPSDASGSLAATNKANIGVRADLLVAEPWSIEAKKAEEGSPTHLSGGRPWWLTKGRTREI